jgi:hypothetical protein
MPLSVHRRYVIPLDTYAALVDTDPVTLTEVSAYSSRDSRLLSGKHVAVIAEILNSYYSRTFLNHTCCPAWLQPPPLSRFRITKT